MKPSNQTDHRSEASSYCTSLLALGVIFLAVFSHSAVSATEVSLRKLILAKSSAEFNGVMKSQELEKHHHRVCSEQLKAVRIPTACFELSQVDLQTWLIDLCSKRAKVSSDWSELAGAISNSQIPSNCRTTAEKRLADLRYSAETESPELLFAHWQRGPRNGHGNAHGNGHRNGHRNGSRDQP